MKINNLRSLIRESIKDYISEIDEAAQIAANEARIAKCDEAIAARESKLARIDENDELKEMIDGAKIKEIQNEIKELKNAKLKFERIAEKEAAKKAKKSAPKEKDEVVTDAMTEDAPPIDETDVMAGMDVTEETTEEAINESFLKMQKLAGVITEAQYNQKIQILNEALEMELNDLGGDFIKAFQEIFGSGAKITDASVRYRPSSDTGKQPELTFGVTIPSVGDKDNYKGALIYTNFLSDGNGFVGYDNYSKDKETTAKEFNEKLIPAWKKASTFVLGNILKNPSELNKLTVGSGYKYEEKDLEDLKKYVASIPNLTIKNT